MESEFSVFRPTEIETRAWRYLANYIRLLDEWCSDHELKREQIIRLMLVGFLPYYRRSNNFGSVVTTDLNMFEKRGGKRGSRYWAMFETYNKIAGKPITSTAEYISLLGLQRLTDGAGISGEKLFDFVLNGKKTYRDV